MVDSLNNRIATPVSPNNKDDKSPNSKFIRTEERMYRDSIKEKFGKIGKFNSEYFEYFDETEPITMNDKRQEYLDIATDIAMKSTMMQKHGAILVYKKDIIGYGYNHHVNNFCIHAEMAAIMSLKGKNKQLLNQCDLYVVRVGPKRYNFPLKYSKPCQKCQDAINKCRIKKTYYSTNYNYDNLDDYI